MKFSKRISLTALLFFTGLSLNILCAQNKNISSFRIEDPDSLKSSSLEIHTKWDFFWGKFIPPYDASAKPDLVVTTPSDWNKYDLPEDVKKITKTGNGSGTYRLQLTNLTPGTTYVFPVYKLAYTSFFIYANNTLIFQSGTPNEEWEKAKPQQYFDAAAFTADASGNALITIFVSNNFYRKGGLRGKFTLYEKTAYQNYHASTLTKHAIFTGILLMISAYCLINYFMKKDKSTLYLSLLILLLVCRLVR